MSAAVELIVESFVKLKDRHALEQMREHRSRLLQESRLRRHDAFDPASLHSVLQEEIEVIDKGLGGLAATT